MTTDPDRKDGESIIGTLGELLRKAVWHYNEGEYSTAGAICQGILASHPENAEAYHIMGHITTRTHAKTAVEYFLRAVRLDPANPKFSRSFAECLETFGHYDQAVTAWDQYVTLKPDDLEALRHLAVLLLRTGHPRRAAETFQTATDIAADDPVLRYQFGLALHHSGEPFRAAEQFDFALQLSENGTEWAECQNALSAAMRECGRSDDAIQHARLAIATAPAMASAHNNLGLALLDTEQKVAALDALETAHRLRPDDPEILNNLGVALAQSGKRTEAKKRFREALRLRPDWADGHLNLANALREEERLEEAIEQYRAALVSAPDDYRILGSLALAQQNINEPEKALVTYERALELAPQNPELLKGLGIVQLLLGDFENGWRHYEWRRFCRDIPARNFNCPEWDGAPIKNGTLLVHAEQGFGDTLQFCRYLPLLKDRADNIVFECQRPLQELMGSLEAELEIIARGDPLPPADSHVALMSLPGLLGTQMDSIPASVPYLSASSDKIAEWHGRLSGEIRPRAGIVWSGNPHRQDDQMRSCPLSALDPILQRDDIFLASLQMDTTDTEIAKLRQFNIPDFSVHIESFSDTAAAISALDLIISVDTATAHLAGALNKPAWVLLGHAADWRYLQARDDSPWYPATHLFRQKTRGDWAELARRINNRLSTLAL